MRHFRLEYILLYLHRISVFTQNLGQTLPLGYLCVVPVLLFVCSPFDLTALKAEQAELESEMTVVSDLIQKCIYENAHVALDQVEYQKRYDGLTARFDAAKARYESLDETIRSKQSRRATIEDFLATLKDANLVDTFDTALWCGLVDFVTVHSKDDVRFTFKNGQEIKA